MSQNPQYPRYRSQTQLLFGFNVELKRPHRKNRWLGAKKNPVQRIQRMGIGTWAKGVLCLNGRMSRGTDSTEERKTSEKGRALVVTFTEPES